MENWFRETRSGLVVVTLIRWFVGVEWLLAGLSKFGGDFTARPFVLRAIAHPVLDDFGNQPYPWFTAFLRFLVEPHIGWYNFLVQYGEIAIGLGLLLGTLTTAANFFGLALNFIYLLSGSISMNPLLLFCEILILMAGKQRFTIGFDYWLMPYLRRKLPFLDRKKKARELHFY